MKKHLICLFDCHGSEILKHLKQNSFFYSNFDTTYIAIQDYLQKDLPESIKDQIKNTDVIILQYIKNIRPYIHHTIIQSYCKKDCIVILVPHYVFSGYWNNFDIPENFTKDKTYNELLEIYKNINITEDNIIQNYKSSIEEVINLEANCTVKMSNFILEKAKNVRLFHERSYPTSFFMFYLSKQILEKLYIQTENDVYIDTGFGKTLSLPILPIVKQTLGLTFDTDLIHLTKKSIFGPIEYYLTCKEINKKTLNFNNHRTNDLETIRKIKSTII